MCLLDDAATADLSARESITRSAAAMRLSAAFLEGAIAAVGNAPTALFELIALTRTAGVRPALVVGVPVGFVGALESKIELSGTHLPFVTNLGERGEARSPQPSSTGSSRWPRGKPHRERRLLRRPSGRSRAAIWHWEG